MTTKPPSPFAALVQEAQELQADQQHMLWRAACWEAVAAQNRVTVAGLAHVMQDFFARQRWCQHHRRKVHWRHPMRRDDVSL
jgi:hypothetical protein